jgi:hypothetical protein
MVSTGSPSQMERLTWLIYMLADQLLGLKDVQVNVGGGVTGNAFPQPVTPLLP